MLCVKVMTLKFDEVRGGYDDAVLNDFLRKHRAVDVKGLSQIIAQSAPSRT